MSQSKSLLPIHLAACFSTSHTTSLHMVSLWNHFLLNDSRVSADSRNLAAHYLSWVINSKGSHPSALVTLKLLVHPLTLWNLSQFLSQNSTSPPVDSFLNSFLWEISEVFWTSKQVTQVSQMLLFYHSIERPATYQGTMIFLWRHPTIYLILACFIASFFQLSFLKEMRLICSDCPQSYINIIYTNHYILRTNSASLQVI